MREKGNVTNATQMKRYRHAECVQPTSQRRVLTACHFKSIPMRTHSAVSLCDPAVSAGRPRNLSSIASARNLLGFTSISRSRFVVINQSENTCKWRMSGHDYLQHKQELQSKTTSGTVVDSESKRVTNSGVRLCQVCTRSRSFRQEGSHGAHASF